MVNIHDDVYCFLKAFAIAFVIITTKASENKNKVIYCIVITYLLKPVVLDSFMFGLNFFYIRIQ